MVSNDFQNYRGIITGAAQGIGLAVAKQLLQDGAYVLINDKDEQVLSQAASQLDPWKGQFECHAADAADKSAVTNLVAIAVQKFGGLNFAIANAGLTRMGPFVNFAEQDLRAMLDLNIAGSFFLAQAAAKHMLDHQQGGRILLMSSTTGVQAHRHTEGYGMTKAALQLLAKNLGAELGPYGITVNCIAPGATLTPRTMEAGPEYANGWSKLIPTGHAASTDDIAAACKFLLSPQAKQINGQTLIIDGGWTGISPLPDLI